MLIWKELAALLSLNMVWNNSLTSRQDLKENTAFSTHLFSAWNEVTGFLSNKSISLFWLTHFIGILECYSQIRGLICNFTFMPLFITVTYYVWYTCITNRKCLISKRYTTLLSYIFSLLGLITFDIPTVVTENVL